MKYMEKHWNPTDDGILYFFQRLEEMLFHYSDDIVRVPVHNTRTLMIEYLKNESETQKGRVKPYQLEQIIEELTYSLQTDKILHENLGEDFIISMSESIKKDRGDGIRYLYSKISNRTYYEWCRKYIKKHARQHAHKKEIECGIRSWISELLTYGYSPEFVYSFLREKMSSAVVDPSQLLDEFLNHFDMKKVNHIVYFSFSPNLLKYKELYSSRMQISFEDDGYFRKVDCRKKDFIGYVNVEALDRNKAAELAYSKILTFIKFYRVISNRRNELVRLYATVRQEDTDNTYKIAVKSDGYRSIEIEPKANLESMVDSVIIGCQGKPKETYSQLCKIVDLHNAAIAQHDLNDGFLNLWSILEIVSSSIPIESKIDKVIEGILPILQKDYFPVVFENIEQDLRDNLTNQDYSELISQLTKDGNTKNCIARFIFLPEFEQLRDDYFIKLTKFPVIRHKIYTLWELRNSKSSIINLSQKYSQRVKWHIYRLYRTRNAIVHSGDSSKSIQSLGEHLHIYVDRILFELLIKIAEEDTLLTVSDVLIDTRLLLSQIKTRFNNCSPIETEDLRILENNYFYSSLDNVSQTD